MASEWVTSGRTLYTKRLRFCRTTKALTTIFSKIDLDQFKITQRCESAKEVCDTLINHFKGDTSVGRIIINHFAHKFENFRIENDESTTSFSPGYVQLLTKLLFSIRSINKRSH